MENEKFLRDNTPIYAVVLRADLETIKEIKEFLAQLDNTLLIYQKYSYEPLYITLNPTEDRDGVK